MSNIVKYDYEGEAVQFNCDGWLHATKIAERFGKKPAQWLRLDTTKEYIQRLSERMAKSNVGKSHITLVSTRRGNTAARGTWLHPKLAIKFARWLSVDFEIWCDEQIDALVRQGMAVQGHEHLIGLLLRQEPAGWERRFPPEFYRALARVTNTRYLGHANGTPALFGQITKRWVYKVIMPKAVLDVLERRRGEQNKLHQWLTDGGAQALERQIAAVTMFANGCNDLRDFESRCMQAFGVPGQLHLVYPD